MIEYILRRIFALIPVAFGVVTIVGLLIHIIPGDPVDQILGDYATAVQKTELRTSLGLDRPITTQLTDYYKQVLRGDLGNSIILKEPVTKLIAERVMPTVELAFAAMMVALLIGIPLGLFSAVKAGSLFDAGAMTIAMLAVSIPNFWLGPMLILLFSIHFGWLPVSDREGWDSYILPAFTMGTALASILSRMTRNSILENLNEDYVRTARAKGNPEWIVVCKHVLRNAALPLVTIIGLQFGVLLSGAIVTEKVFNWPGLGSLLLNAIENRDYPLVQGMVLVLSASYLVVNLLTDLSYALVDPRIKLK